MATQIYLDLKKDGTKTITGDLDIAVNEEAVMESVVNIIMTEKRSKVYRKRNFGVNLKRFVFEPVDRITAIELYEEIKNGIETYEYRAKDVEVTISPIPNDNEFLIDIYFTIEESENPVEIHTALSKIR